MVSNNRRITIENQNCSARISSAEKKVLDELKKK